MGKSESIHDQIADILQGEENLDAFLRQLKAELWAIKRDDSVFRRPEVQVPRSHTKSRLAMKAKADSRRLRNSVEALLDSHVYRSHSDRECIVSELVDLQRFGDFLERIGREVTPRKKTGDRYRQRTGRYVLRSLMWLWKAYFPNRPISYATRSRFYRVAKICLESIGVYRDDIRKLIRQEKMSFKRLLRRSPMPNFSNRIREGKNVMVQVMLDA